MRNLQGRPFLHSLKLAWLRGSSFLLEAVLREETEFNPTIIHIHQAFIEALLCETVVERVRAVVRLPKLSNPSSTLIKYGTSPSISFLMCKNNNTYLIHYNNTYYKFL